MLQNYLKTCAFVITLWTAVEPMILYLYKSIKS